MMEPVFILDLLGNEDTTEKNSVSLAPDDPSEEDIAGMLALLEGFGNSEVGRLNVQVSADVAAGKSAKVSHHGRCDVGSPWAKGDAFDVLEDAGNAGC